MKRNVWLNVMWEQHISATLVCFHVALSLSDSFLNHTVAHTSVSWKLTFHILESSELTLMVLDTLLASKIICHEGFFFRN